METWSDICSFKKEKLFAALCTNASWACQCVFLKFDSMWLLTANLSWYQYAIDTCTCTGCPSSRLEKALNLKLSFIHESIVWVRTWPFSKREYWVSQKTLRTFIFSLKYNFYKLFHPISLWYLAENFKRALWSVNTYHFNFWLLIYI